MKQDLVSIIVPIYNVEPYLDECIASLVNQTYKILEIILINDGSTDGSLEKCYEWRDKDSRIKVYSKENEGLGPTRNFGVKHATGEWIVFVDSDDWIELSYVEKMYAAVKKNDAEMARCNMRNIESNGGSVKETNHFQVLGKGREQKAIMVEDASLVCKVLVRRSIFEKFYLEQPNCKSQDFAVGLSLCLAVSKCVYVEDALYNYRRGRVGALTTGSSSKRHETATIAFPWFIDVLKKNGFYEENIELIKKHVYYFMSTVLFGGWMSMPSSNYLELKKLYVDTMCQYIHYESVEVAHLGSWNLTETLRKISCLQDMDYAFHFSSLISIMSQTEVGIEIPHKSNYRKKMIERDIASSMWDVFDRQTPEWFVFDLLEERNHIFEINESYITESDALKECEMQFTEGKIIKSGSEEWFVLWKSACDAFMLKVQLYIPLDRIIMVRNYLAEEYGDVYKQTRYDEIEFIRMSNITIRKCYDYIEKRYPQIKVIDVSKEQYYITDIKYQHGVQPCYLNMMINEMVAEKIVSLIECSI